MYHVKVILLGAACLALAAAAWGADAGSQRILAEAQGTWVGERVVDNKTLRMEKTIAGSKETVRMYDGDQVAHAWTVDFEIKKADPVTVFTYRNFQMTEGPYKGQASAGPASYLFQIRDDQWIEAHGLMNGDKNAPRLAVFKRKQSQPASPAPAQAVTAEDYMRFWQPLVGTWKTTTESAGKALPGKWKGLPSPIKTCYLVHGEDGGYPATCSVDGYDPVSKKWTTAGFDAEGGFYLAAMEIANMRPGKVLAPGPIGASQMRLFQKDGTVRTSSSTVSCLECGENRVVLLYSERKENGQPKPDEKWTCERDRDAKTP